MKYVEKISKLADKFENKLKKYAQLITSLTPNQVAPILDKNNLWGGVPFNTNGKVADVIFGAMDKVGFKGKFDASLIIDPKYGVKIVLEGSNPKMPQLQSMLQSYFAAKMAQSLKQSKVPPPDGELTVGWLSDVANV